MKILRSFKPLIDGRSQVLILGSMPGPEALRKRQYYGFDGNHFWTIIPTLLGQSKPATYEQKIALVKRSGIGIWDVLASCERPTAMDSDIRCPQPNPIPELLSSYPNVRAVFINGRTAHKIFMKHFGESVDRPVFYLPSSSPAHASMTLSEKTEKWRLILDYLEVAGPSKMPRPKEVDLLGIVGTSKRGR